jgi:outer membrane protein
MAAVRAASAAFGIAVAAVALAGIAAPPLAGSTAAAATPRPGVTPRPLLQTLPQPTPYPEITLGPANAPTSLPFPAYGSPVPGVGKGPAPVGIPQIVTLAQAQEIAFARSPSLVSARADEGIAHAAMRLAQTGYYPSITGSGTTTHTNHQGASSAQAAASGYGDSTSNSLSIGIRQLIFDGGKIAASIRSASYSETAYVDTYKRDLQTVAFNVAQAYYNALLAERTTAVAVQTVKLDQVQEDLVRANIRAGTEAPADLATAQLPTAQARVALIKAQAAEYNAIATFANALGLDANINIEPYDDTPVNATGAVSTIPVPAYDQALVRAYALRPDLAASLHDVQSGQAALREAKLGLFPTLSGSATAQTASTNQQAGAYLNGNSIGLVLTVPLFDQGITAADVLEAHANLDKYNAAVEISRQSIQLSVKQALVNLVAARSQLDEAQAEIQKANEVLRATQAEYRAGVTTLPLLLNAQVGITQALVDQVSAVYSLRQAEQTYLYAVGANTP